MARIFAIFYCSKTNMLVKTKHKETEKGTKGKDWEGPRKKSAHHRAEEGRN
jgi:hypothetical protein